VALEVGDVHAVIAHSLGCAAATLAERDGLGAAKLVFVAPPLNPADYLRQFGAMFGLNDEVIDGLQARVEERFLRVWTDYSLARAAPSMKASLLVIHDTEDDDTPWSGGAKLTELWPDSTLITTNGLGHRRILRDPEVVSAAAKFIAT
jgi:pimeloyl-ACP methyl ester carboxylesterase